MATKGKPQNPGYLAGTHWANCQRCDFTYRSPELKEEWTGLWVCDDCWEARHPQDLLRVLPEKVAADQPLHPSDTSNTIDVTFAETFTVEGGTFDDNNGTL